MEKKAKKKKPILDIVPSEDLLKDLRKLLSMTPEQLRGFAEAANSDTGFGLEKEFPLSTFLRENFLKADDFASAYRVAYFLFQQLEKSEQPFAQLEEQLRSFLTGIDEASLLDTRIEPLKLLLTPRPEYLDREHKLTYEKGITYRLYSIAATQEMRGVFSAIDDDDTSPKGLIPLITCRLIAKNEKDENKELVFTADLEAMDSLLEKLQDARGRLVAMKDALKGCALKIIE